MIRLEMLVCPVDGCGWQHMRVPPPVADEALAAVFGPGVMKAVALAQELQKAEDATREHMAGHTAEEFLRTITRLQGLLGDGRAGWGPPSVRCPLCRRTSYHPRDVEHGYCGACRAYTSPGAEPVEPLGRARQT